MRLDSFLAQIQNISRNKASDFIKNAKVLVNNKTILKPSFVINQDDDVKLKADKIYVSRAARKLESFLENFEFLPENKNCLDIGSSTGGFIQILLEFGAKKVTGVDVGKNQLDESLKNVENLEVFEEVDVRKFNTKEKFEYLTCDVSFISVNELLKSIDNLAKDIIIILFKPQFEVGKNVKRNSKGVVKDELQIKFAINKFEANVRTLGWILLKKEYSKLKGKEGNAEIFYAYKKR